MSYSIGEAFQVGVERRLAALNSFGISATTFASSVNASWPFVTIPAFELQSSAVKLTAGAQSMALLPIVNNSSRIQWERYAADNRNHWYQRNASIDPSVALSHGFIYQLSGNGQTVNDTGRTQFLPLWQSSPAFLEKYINFDLLSDPVLNLSANSAIESKKVVLSDMIEPTSSMSDIFTFDSPFTMIFFPLSTQEGQVLAVLAMDIVWEDLIANQQAAHSNGMVVVLENSAGQEYTYLASSTGAELLGKGDLHDSAFDRQEETFELNAILSAHGNNEVSFNTAVNTYRIRVYPSHDLLDEIKSNRPIILSVIVNLMFVFFVVVFICYNRLVERWRSKLIQNAMRSTEIVSSLFPSTVRDRLLNTDRMAPEANVILSTGRGLIASDLGGRKDFQRNTGLGDTPKVKLQSFLSNVPVAEYDSDEEFHDSRPIADLFPNTTVMFADICGFTAWSSAREPSQVFMLLESLYRAFDKLAIKRRVFKVETIGDCYMAVTGLPEAQEDHAIIMARFAQDCIIKMKDVTRKLELTLGPETTDLSLRVGLHSGPVTAGVLRGEKSRFQLFGDTVNTASRMETTGLRDSVQVSAETAQLLYAAGKSHWVKQREDPIYAKGKGELTTFVLTLKAEGGGSTAPSSVAPALHVDERTGSSRSGDSKPVPGPVVKQSKATHQTHELDCMESQQWGYASLDGCRDSDYKHERLIDWNVEILLRLLKSVVAKRRLVSRRLSGPNRVPLGDDYVWESKTTLLEEVTEIIVLPEFDGAVGDDFVDHDGIELNVEVAGQLRSYVEFIASMYKDVPFHNFEHASHVALSANKLIQRIVAADGMGCYHEITPKKKRREMLAKDRHDYTFGITSDPLTQFAVVFSALIHDVDHPGVSNFQLIKENAPMVQRYNGKSVLEQNSIDLSWETLMKPQYKELRKCIYTNEDEVKRFRQVVVNCVMATDIFDRELQNLRRQRWSKAFQVTARTLPLSRTEDCNRKATIVIEHIIQASDVAHTMQHWHLYQKWNERLFQEMLLAFQTGRAGKPPTIGWFQGELGFFDNYVIPLANKLNGCGVFGVSGEEYLNYALENRREWAMKGEEIVLSCLGAQNLRE